MSSNAFAQVAGSAPPRLFYYAIENLDAGRIDGRGVSASARLPLENLVLAPSTRYRFWILRAADLAIGGTTVKSPVSGARFTIPGIGVRPISVFDTDEDALPDAAETIVGTSARNGSK